MVILVSIGLYLVLVFLDEYNFQCKKYFHKFTHILRKLFIKESSEDIFEQALKGGFDPTHCNYEELRQGLEWVRKVKRSLKYLNLVPYLPIAQEHPYFLEAQKANHWKSLKYGDFNIITNKEIGVVYCVGGITVFYIFNKVFRCSENAFFDFKNKVS